MVISEIFRKFSVLQMIFAKFLMHRWQNIRLRQKESANITIQPYAKKGLTPHGLLPFLLEKKKPEHTKAAPAVSLENALKHFEEVLGKTKDS